MPLKVLIIRFSSIGDLVLTTPVIRTVRQQLGAEIHFLTKKVFAPIVEHNPYVSRVITLQDNIDPLLKDLQQERYDHVIDLHHNLRTKRIKLALGRPSSSFYKLNVEKWVRVRLGINWLPDIHIVDRYMKTVAGLGVVGDGQGLDFFIPPDQVVDVESRFNLRPGSFVAMVIGAAHATKCLTTDQLSSLCDLVGKPVILLGGTSESARAEKIIALSTNPIVRNACGQFTILESASILRQSGSVLTHDTGLMHVAAAFKKSQVVVWGNTIPQFGMYPYYGEHDVKWISFEQSGLRCRPCTKLGHDVCPKGHFKCMLDHKLEDIAAAVVGLME